MGCEGAHAHVRFAVTHMCVRAKCILKCVCDVRACGPFWGVRCAITLSTLFSSKLARICYFTTSHILKHIRMLLNRKG